MSTKYNHYTMHASQEPDLNSVLPLLERVGNLISSPVEGEALSDQLLDELISGLGADACWVYILDAEKEEFNLISHRGLTPEMATEMGSLRLGQGLPGKVALIKEPLLSSGMYPSTDDTLVSFGQAGFRCCIAAPMISHHNVLGVIGLCSSTLNQFTSSDLKLLSVISYLVAAAIDRSLLVHGKDNTEKIQLFSAISDKQEFLNALSHELQTPLTALIASAGLLMDELQKEPRSPQARLARNIARSASSLQNRLTELLNLARTKTARFRIERETFDFPTLFHKVVEELSPLVKNKKQSIFMEIPISLAVTADKQRIEQILLNLLSNAIKFTPQGGQITLRTKRDMDNIIVEVQDTGPGIPEGEQAELFQPYYRRSADRHRLPGLGLGLVITKQLVELHNGRIWMRSEPGKGSTFAFSLPLN